MARPGWGLLVRQSWLWQEWSKMVLTGESARRTCAVRRRRRGGRHRHQWSQRGPAVCGAAFLQQAGLRLRVRLDVLPQNSLFAHN